MNDKASRTSDLVNGTQQKIQLELNFAAVSTGNAPRTEHREAPKPLTVTREHESQEEDTKQLTEEIVREANLYEALKKVRRNKGSPGIDGMTVGELPGFLRKHWPMIQRKLLEGTYQPKPVKRVEIPKPDGGKRKRGGTDGVGSVHSAGDSSGAPEAMGSNLLGLQLRIPAEALGASGHGPSARTGTRGVWRRRGHRPGKVL